MLSGGSAIAALPCRSNSYENRSRLDLFEEHAAAEARRRTRVDRPNFTGTMGEHSTCAGRLRCSWVDPHHGLSPVRLPRRPPPRLRPGLLTRSVSSQTAGGAGSGQASGLGCLGSHGGRTRQNSLPSGSAMIQCDSSGSFWV